MRTKLLALCSLLFIILLTVSICAQEMLSIASEPILSGCEQDYPPFCIVHPDGRADGFSVELLQKSLAVMGREVVFNTGTWVEVRDQLLRSEI